MSTKVCGDCVQYLTETCPRCEYKDMEQNRIACQPDDSVCEEFKPKRKRRRQNSRESSEKGKTWKLDLDLPKPEEYKPCGFFKDALIEGAWLPYQSEDGEVALRPSLVIKLKSEEVEVKDFLDRNLGLTIHGTFPSKVLQTLMTPKAVKMILAEEVLEPKAIDKEIDAAIEHHCEIGRKRQIVLKRWIEATYFYDVFDCLPILNIMGVSESGKSRILLIVLSMSYHGQGVVNPSEASIFRSKEEDKVTLGFDEAEYLNNPAMNQTLRALINASYSKGMGVPRYDEVDGKRVKRMFDLYSPFAIVGITGLEGITASRAIRIITQRSDRDFPKARPEDYVDLRDKLYTLRFDLAFKIREVYETLDISHIVRARFEELFKPLFVMTKVFGTEEEWDALAEWAKMYQDTFRAEALNVVVEEQILMILAEMDPLPDDWYYLKDLRDKVNLTYSRKLSSQRISQILMRIGITERRKVKGSTQFRITKESLKLMGKRLGIELPEYEVKPKDVLKAINVYCRIKSLNIADMIKRVAKVERVE